MNIEKKITYINLGLFLAISSLFLFELFFNLSLLSNARLDTTALNTIDEWNKTIILEIRLPRLLLAVIVGMLLAICGNAMQGVFQNPLASPDLLGSSSAATLSSVIVLYWGQASIWILLFSGVIGSFLCFLFIFLIAYRYSSATLILTGVAVNALLGSMIALVLSNAKNPWAMSELYLWLQGSLSLARLDTLLFSAIFFIPGALLIFSQRRLIDALILGEETAMTLGIEVKRSIFITILGVSFIIGSIVPQTGIISFIGLVAPHIARLVIKQPPTRLYLTSALLGGFILLVADGLVWHVMIFNSIYVGTLTALIGAPFLVMILIKQRRYLWS